MQVYKIQLRSLCKCVIFFLTITGGAFLSKLIAPQICLFVIKQALYMVFFTLVILDLCMICIVPILSQEHKLERIKFKIALYEKEKNGKRKKFTDRKKLKEKN